MVEGREASGVEGYWELCEEKGEGLKRNGIRDQACKPRMASFSFIFNLSR